ncbi:MAG: hypothetical protein FWB74_05970 [Defluviitaleaceae bacterium]|nr:hypothetical protein [Defluviitaleaceae bacterium]
MKKFVMTVVLVIMLAGLSACVYEDVYPVAHEGQPAVELEWSIPIDTAAYLIERTHAIWDADGGELWGFHLKAPLMFAHPLTRHVVTNMPDNYGYFTRHGDVYIGYLPPHVFVSHTIADFGGLTWGMVAWGDDIYFGTQTPQGIDSLLRLIIHEGFHAIQFHEIVHGGWPRYADQSMPSLTENAAARTTILLELNALFAALSTEGESRAQAIHDALSIRAHRRYHYPESAITEIAQEINEGLAVFTEILAFESLEAFVEHYFYGWFSGLGNIPSLGAMAMYYTGAAYAFLLEYAGADWQNDITFYTDLAALLKEALEIESLTPFNEIDLSPYGYNEIAPAQAAWVENFLLTRQRAEEFVQGRTIFLPGISVIDWMWEYTRIETIFVNTDDGMRHLVFYGDFVEESTNWRVSLNGGHVLVIFHPESGSGIAFYDNITVSEDGTRAEAPSWTLEIIDENYKITQLEDGDIEITRR